MNKLQLLGKNINIVINNNLSVTVLRRDGRLLWKSSESQTPAVLLQAGDGKSFREPLSSANDISVLPFNDEKYKGYTIRLSSIRRTDAVLEITFAIHAPLDELLVQVAQVGGDTLVTGIEHLYRFEKPVTSGGYMVIPHGSGYLIPADCPDELPGNGYEGGMIGARWTLPMFGMVHNNDALQVIVETWWDCDVHADHIPGDKSALDFNWLGSLGKLDYPRRFIVRFADGMDYVGMAKFYRDYAKSQGLLRTLKEKAEITPVIKQYIENILVRWPTWNTKDCPAVLADIDRLKKMGFGINFFFPKWSSAGYSTENNTIKTANCLWQAYLHPDPVPGGWQSLVEYADRVHKLGCVVQGFITLSTQDPAGPEYDEYRWPRDAKGLRLREGLENQPVNLSTHDALERIVCVLDNIEAKKFKIDVLYFDGYSAHHSMPEDFSASHPVTRRQIFETQNACFAETRRRGIIPGGELHRFWCMADCDYFFFTDWSSDRLTNVPTQGATVPVGYPIPLFQLVFHDCYIAGFSGGGYELYAPGYDWWENRTPRLYELIFASAPSHNWLPDGYVPIRNWEDDKTQERWSWLKQWSAYYRAIATSEMVSHKFSSQDYSRQSIEFANGVSSEFDTIGNRFRIFGVPGSGKQWVVPPEL